jgi:hypothetical protein
MTVALLAVETVILVLLSILVVGLLRSHAEILRRLGPEGEAESGSPRPAGPEVAPDRADAPPATDIAGVTLDGDAVQVGLGSGGVPTLLAFLSTGCTTCQALWRDFEQRRGQSWPGGVRLVLVVKDSSHERPARLRELAPPEVPLVMSSAAWEAYAVPTTPYFIYVDGASGRVYGEGTASSWEQVASLLADALDDLRSLERPDAGARAGSGSLSPAAERALRAERALQESGIGPGHPSLYPTGNGGSEEG